MHGERNVAILGALRRDFRISFFNAALMKDPAGVLERQGPNTRHPGMIMIGHHDRAKIEALRKRADKKGRVVRIVDQKTAVVPLHADTLADPHKLLASVRSLLELA